MSKAFKARLLRRHEPAAGIVELILSAPEPLDAVPGQFVEAVCGGGTLLRRPFSSFKSTN